MDRITDVLYWDYVTNRAGTDSEEVSTRLDKLYAEFELFQKHGIINAGDREALYDLILQVCDLHRKAGFEAGLKTAYTLGKEIKEIF